MKNVILFVCTGNSCRSPMAEGYLKSLLNGREDVEVLSAGLAGFEGLSASDEAIELMERIGVDLSKHQSQKCTAELIERATLILAMTKYHRMQIMELCPEAGGKVFLLKEFDQRVEENFLDIPDPMGHPMADYELCFQKMKPPIEYIAEHILKPKQGE